MSLTIFISAFCSWLLLRSLIPAFRRGFVDQPNARSSHLNPTPRGGGIVFVFFSSSASFIALISGQAFSVNSLPLLVAPLAAVGLFDDRNDLAASCRYGAQLITAALILCFSPLVQSFVFAVAPSNLLLIPLLIVLLIAVTAVINFTNFMDGLDGLVAGCMVVAMTAAAFLLAAPWPICVLLGALLGFLLWNWCPAKVFMGDVGSTFLGAVFAGLVLQAPSWREALGMLLVATPLLGDACLCVLRRLLAGHSVFQAHRLHLFQRLHQAGWTHDRVSSLYILGTIVLAIALLFGGLIGVTSLAVLLFSIGIWLDQRVAVPFSKASRR